MKRICVWLLVIMMVVPVVPVTAGSLVGYEENTDLGKVVEIIDGEVMKVFFYRRNFMLPSVEVVRVIGLNTEASEEAFDYATSRLLGKTVFFLYDDRYEGEEDGMTYAHLFVDYDQTYAEEVLSLGYGYVDVDAEDSVFYHDLQAAEYSAELYEIGRWATSLSDSTDRINMNTASKSLILEVLDVTEEQATAIGAYRDQNAFNDIFELMAVDYALDSEWFDENSHLMSVVTNINQTSYLELTSLMPSYVNSDLVLDELDYYLKFNQVTTMDQLHEVEAFSGYLGVVEPFVTLETTNIYEEPNKLIANVNTVSEEDFLTVTGLTKYDYSKLEKMRDEGDYVITSLAELYRHLDNYIYNKANAYIYNNRLTALTNMNEAQTFELRTLLSASDLSAIERQELADKIILDRPFYSNADIRQSVGYTVYNAIEPYMYLYDGDIPSRYNPNTADEEDLDYLDAKYDGVYTNFTNVNLASRAELLDLHDDMTVKLVNDILTYRARYPFRDNDDLHDIFVEQDREALYNSIAYYLSYE